MASANAPRKRITKTSSQKKGSSKSDAKKQPMRREVKLFIVGFLIIALMFSYYTPWFGIVGRIIKNIGLAFFGAPGFAIPLYLAALFIHSAHKGKIKPYTKIYVCTAIALSLISCFLTINASEGFSGYDYFAGSNPLGTMIEGGKNLTDGGIVGALGVPMKALFGTLGSRLVIIFAVILLIAASTKFVPIIWFASVCKQGFDILSEKIKSSIEERKERLAEEEAEAEEEEVYDEPEPIEEPRQLTINMEEPQKPARRERVKKETKKAEVTEEPQEPKKKKPPTEKKAETDDTFDINIFIPNEASEKPQPSQESDDISFIPFSDEELLPPVSAKAPEAAAEPPKTEQKPQKTEPEPPKAEQKTTKAPNKAIELSEDELIVDTPPYTFPPISLLEESSGQTSASSAASLREQAAKLVETLKSFGVEARVLEVSKGPSVTRFEIQPSVGVKVSKITNLADDIALNLAALSVRIEAPIPGKAAVGIEIPNADNSIVRLREVIDSPAFKNFSAKTAFALGKDITGRPVITDIAKMPHALIAGATGSGKSVCINALITSIIYKADPSEVKLIMIDPKVVELSVYNGIPHLLIPVVTDPRKAAGALNWAVQEMTKRYKLFADNNVRDIKGYNELASLNGEETLPQIIIIVDELADLMMVAPHDVEDAICRLAQLARAAGMHLVIATQRPSVDVITGLIKANVPSRIAFAVSSQIDSRTILDMGGAEKLLGKGDMLFLPMGASKPKRVQGAFISDKEVNRIVEFVKNPDVKYDEDVIEKIERGVSDEKEPDGGDADELLPQAIETVVEAGQASASLLQRRLKVGYSRAGRLIDQLEARGIIGPHEGAKPRAVLMSRAEYAEMTMQSDSD